MTAVNELDKTADIIEIKCNTANINFEKLKENGLQFVKVTGKLSNYKIECKSLPMNDM